MQQAIQHAQAMVNFWRASFDAAVQDAESRGIDHTNETENYHVIELINHIHEQLLTWREHLESLIQQQEYLAIYDD